MDLFDKIIYGSRATVNILGIVGNLISFLIFSRPIFNKNSISIYCRALAIFDCFTLPQIYTDVNLLFFNSYPPDNSEAFCKISHYVYVAFSCIPAWILVGFAIDKVLNMKTTKLEFYKKRSFQLSLIAAIAIFHAAVYSEILIFIKRVPDISRQSLVCQSKSMPYVDLIGALYLLEGSLIPFVIMFATSIVMTRSIIRSRNRAIGRRKNSVLTKRKIRDIKFAITSLTFNILFVILKLPLIIYYLLFSINTDLGFSFFQVATLLFFINSSISFVVHMVSNSIFRKEFFNMSRSVSSTQVQITQIQSTIIIVHPKASTIDEN